MRCGSTLALIYVTACQTVETRATVTNPLGARFTDGDATNAIALAFMFYVFTLSAFLLAPQGENPIYKSAVTTVVNPKYEGKWWSFAVTTLYGTECGINGAGFLMLSLFVCCSHKTLAFCHYFSFTNCFCLLCILWKCTVCIDVGGLFHFFSPMWNLYEWTDGQNGKKKCFFVPS